jgi:hypothetical protein
LPLQERRQRRLEFKSFFPYRQICKSLQGFAQTPIQEASSLLTGSSREQPALIRTGFKALLGHILS